MAGNLESNVADKTVVECVDVYSIVPIATHIYEDLPVSSCIPHALLNDAQQYTY